MGPVRCACCTYLLDRCGWGVRDAKVKEAQESPENRPAKKQHWKPAMGAITEICRSSCESTAGPAPNSMEREGCFMRRASCKWLSQPASFSHLVFVVSSLRISGRPLEELRTKANFRELKLAVNLSIWRCLGFCILTSMWDFVFATIAGTYWDLYVNHQRPAEWALGSGWRRTLSGWEWGARRSGHLVGFKGGPHVQQSKKTLFLLII